jgi:hypothetical protein
MSHPPDPRKIIQPTPLSAQERAILEQRQRTFAMLKSDLPTFARYCLKIRDKQGKIIPLEFNKAQLFLHQKLEEQKAKLGFIRAVILKGRQQGASTYTAARFFHQTLLGQGATTFILSHEAKSTGALFGLVKRFYELLPPGMAPDLDTANQNQLKFAGTFSEYTVGTAGNEEVGRSMTLKYLHMSEVASYEHTDGLETGLMQAVADMPGTEIIMESTAKGLGNMFHERAMKAQAGLGLDQLIFLPWYWQTEYTLQPPAGFSPDESEIKLLQAFNLSSPQIYWRRKKIESTKGGLWTFNQEYPMTPAEAFLMSGDTFLSKELLTIARKTKALCPNAPVIMGVDCARENDRSVFVLRRGREIFHYEVYPDLKVDGVTPTQQLINIAVKLINKYQVAKVFIDAGYGWGLIDGLHGLGYRKEVTGVQFAQQPLDTIRALNKRAEMALLYRDWLEEGNVSIPDTDEFIFDMLLTPKEKETPTHRLFLPKKSEIKQKSKVSTDIFDGTILTFAFPVNANLRSQSMSSRVRNITPKAQESSLATMNRLRNRGQGNTATARIDFG